MFDLKKTLELIQGALLEPRSTWQSYMAESHGWRDTAMLLTLPMIVASAVLAGLLSWVFSSYYLFGIGMGVGAWLFSLVITVIGIAAAAFIFSYLAGVFNGRHDFDRGLAALSLATVPSFVGSVLGTLPFIGWLISLALFIVSLVFLYQIIPSYLEVPEDKRVLHYVASLVATFVVSLVLSMILGVSGMAPMHDDLSMSGEQSGQAGVFGGIERYAKIMEQAEKDRYEPPADGKIGDEQMDRFMSVMRKTAEVRGEQMARIERLQEQVENQKSDGASLSTLAGNVGSVLGAFSAEMEVVITGEGNWAEHQWIKEQLRVASIQKDINEAVKHNYALYEAHRAELEELGAGL
jgi:hypothetical protein